MNQMIKERVGYIIREERLQSGIVPRKPTEKGIRASYALTSMPIMNVVSFEPVFTGAYPETKVPYESV
jgi:hypothetical protein